MKEKSHIDSSVSFESEELTNLVDYQQGSVVSRTIINKEKGTVTLFAFDAGQSLSEHTAPFDALAYIFDGIAEITVSGKTNRLKEGMVKILPADKPHAVNAISQFKMMLIMIRS
jgi:quercetin dioxygenase-like cupin family protein